MKIKFPFKLCFFGLYLLSVDNPVLADNCCFKDYYYESFCDGDFNLGIEWLYWEVKEDHLRAASFVDDFPDPTLKIANASIIEPKSKFNHAFRGNIGYSFFCNQWELNAFYTYIPLDSKSDFKETIPLDQQTETHRQFIIPNFNDFPSFQGFGSDGLVAFTSLLAKWNGDLSYVDIDLAYRLIFNNSFNFKPHFGFRSSWMTQHLLMEGGLIFPSTNDSTFGSLKFTEKFNGYGIEGGFWANWQLGCGFDIIGHLGGSILYSCFQIDILSESSIGESGPVVFIINSSAKNTTAIPTIDYFVGIRYRTDLCNFLVSSHVGWEERVFFNMNQMSTIGGNLSLQGLTIGVNVNF